MAKILLSVIDRVFGWLCWPLVVVVDDLVLGAIRRRADHRFNRRLARFLRAN